MEIVTNSVFILLECGIDPTDIVVNALLKNEISDAEYMALMTIIYAWEDVEIEALA